MEDPEPAQKKPEEQMTFQEVMLELGRDMAFDGVPIKCARCGKREMISGLCKGGSSGFHTGYVCEDCEPTDDD